MGLQYIARPLRTPVSGRHLPLFAVILSVAKDPCIPSRRNRIRYIAHKEGVMRRADWLATEGTVANVLSFYARGRKSYDVTFSYIVDGHVYQSTFPTFDEHVAGDMLAVTYDPSDPNKNNFVAHQKNVERVYWGIVAILLLGMLSVWLWVRTQ
jgi:hypothetical protein